MYKKIMVPVDLERVELLSGVFSVASRLADANGGELYIAGVHGAAPSSVAHNPEEYRRRLDEFTKSQPFAEMGKVHSIPVYSHDPGVEIASALVKAACDHEMDLIVMASHIPSWSEHIFHSNAGYVACHAPMSVFVVR